MARLARRARAEGLDFDAFWSRALRVDCSLVTRYDHRPPDDCVIWPRDTWDRRNDIEALMATRPGWQRAYEMIEPTRDELALLALRPEPGTPVPVSGYASGGDVRSAGERDHAVAA